MVGFASDELQFSIFNALKGDPTLSAATVLVARQLFGDETVQFGDETVQFGFYKSVTGVGGRIYDQAKEDEVYPYITIGASTSDDQSNKSKDGANNTLMIQVWSEMAGNMETKEIMAAVQSVLNHNNLEVYGQTLIDIRCEFTDVSRLRDERGFYYRGSMRFRTLTQEA